MTASPSGDDASPVGDVVSSEGDMGASSQFRIYDTTQDSRREQ